MNTPTTLNDPNKLTQLIYELEGGKGPRLLDITIGKVIVSPNTDYPQLSNLFIIPKKAPTAIIHSRDERDLWIKEIIKELDILPNFSLDDVTLAMIIIPGSKPERAARFSIGNIRIRFLSALEHLWSDRLRITEHTQIDDTLKELSSHWNDSDEEKFINPAISPLNETSLSKLAVEQLKDNDPSILDNGLILLYGPGGIGKTYFLRRLVWRFTKRCLKDYSLGIPVFAILPTLLHQDALENYLAKQKVFSNLSLDQIRALIKHQILIPFLDAFDELVRGAVRDGCKDFLIRLGELMSKGGAGLLTSRDYFLNVDPLIPSSLSNFEVAQLTLGFFDKQGRRSFIHHKTNLDDAIVAKWSKSLEEQVEALFGLSLNKDKEIDGLVGHPLFMEALCNYINNLPPSEVSKAAEEFQFKTPNVFGEIVTRVLEREQEKARFGWKAKFGDKFVGEWSNGPFSADHQLDVLTHLSCIVAEHGSEKTKKIHGKDWTHGLFSFHVSTDTTELSIQSLADRKEALKRLLRGILREPDLAPTVSEEEAVSLREQANAEIAEFYLQHTLSDTEPSAPKGLIFATRNKAYFEFFLAQKLVNNIYDGLNANDATGIVEWSDRYHIFDDYQDCLQFALWDHRIANEGFERLLEIFSGDKPADDTIASYCLSLALALALRRNATRNEILFLQDLSFAPEEGWRLEILSGLLPVISRLRLERIAFPSFAFTEIEFRGIKVEDCDFGELKLSNCKLYDVDFIDLACLSLRFSGTITFQNCTLQIPDIDPTQLFMDRGSTIHFTNCKLSQSLTQAIDMLPSEFRSRIFRTRCHSIADEELTHELEGLSKGNKFLHKLMNLLKRHGKSTWGVYYFKLRGRSGIDSQFDQVLQVLIDRKIIVKSQHAVTLRPEMTEYMFDGKRRPGRPHLDDYEEIWKPVIDAIDAILG